MTSLDPSHLPSRHHRSRGAAVYSASTSKGFALPIPDLRFEQSYLKSIARYIHRRDTNTPSQAELEKDDPKSTKEEAVEDGALVSRLEEPSEMTMTKPSDIYSIEWGRVAYITVRDQVLSPLIQGLVWGVASFYLRPLTGQVWDGIQQWRERTRRRGTGQGVAWLRSWGQSLLGGVQTNAALAK